MSEEQAKVVLVPRAPENLHLDILFIGPRGLTVLVPPRKLQVLTQRGIPWVELFASGNEYAAAMHGLDEEEALALVDTVQDRAFAALSAEERSEFGLV